MKSILRNPEKNIWRKVSKAPKVPSTIYEHFKTADHHTSMSSFSIVGRETQNLYRTIKEAVFTIVNDPYVSRNGMRFCSTPQNSSSSRMTISNSICVFIVPAVPWRWHHGLCSGPRLNFVIGISPVGGF